MKKTVSVLLISVLALGTVCLTACGKKQEDAGAASATPSEATAAKRDNGDLHTVYFRDSSKSQKVIATFFNSITEESEDVEMVRCGEDADACFFSCEGNVRKYNVAYFSYDDKKSKNFAFNRCVSGWQKTSGWFIPYTHGSDADYIPDYEHISLDCNGFDKKIHIWTPEDYEKKKKKKYSTIYVLDGQNEVNTQNPETRPDDCLYTPEQVRSMAAETGYKAIVVAVSTYGDMTNYMRDDELVPDLGELAEKEYINKKKGGDFARFMAETLVPYIQQNYNVYTDALHTAVTGASLGGLETFYITMEYPEIFCTAGSFSPSFRTYDDEARRSFLGEKDFTGNAPFIYLYTGPAGGDTDPDVTEMYERLKDMGYPEDKLAFHYNENGGHHAKYWRAYFSEFLSAMAFQSVEPLQK